MSTDNSSDDSTTFNFGVRIGLFILFEISLVSACAIVILLAKIAYSTVSLRSGSRRRWRIKYALHIFLLNQLVFDLIQALGGLMNLKWVVDAQVQGGSFCVAQGLIKQSSDVGTALSAGTVAIWTFSTVIFRLKPDNNKFRASLIVAVIWLAIILDVVINVTINGARKFYKPNLQPTNYWCWIAQEFHVQRTVADFMWMWISAFSSVLAYVAVFLVLRGFITVEGWRVQWTYGQASRQNSPSDSEESKFHSRLLLYPFIYILTVIPVTGARYHEFHTDHQTSFTATAITDGFYLASGLLNVLLYAYTRPDLLPHASDSPDSQSIAIYSDPAQNRNDLQESTIFGQPRVVDSDPSPIEPQTDDPAYDAPEMAQHQLRTLPITTHASDRDAGHNHESSGEPLVRRGPLAVNISEDEV